VKQLRALISTAVVLAVVVFFAGCRADGKQGSPSAVQQQAGAKKFHIRGIVVSSDAKTGAVTLDTEAIPGYMEAMTMPYTLAQPNIATELHRGDTITATLTVTADADVLDEIDVIAQAKPDYKPAVTYNDLEPGETVPDFAFRNQSGRTVRLAEWKGKVVLLTFIYTRCPLEDYCPRMNKNFARVDEQLRSDAALYKETHLLSISFDPENDTPAVLKSYGGIYNGGDAKEFGHWEFAAPPEGELQAMEQFFDLGVTPGESGTFNHSMSTAVIGRDGRVRAWYATNEWTPAEVLAEMKSAAAAS
jgi:protein SCO1